MKMKLTFIFIFALFPTLLSFIAHASQYQYDFPVAKSNCVDRCGNISIPYPAGTTPECYHNPVFWVNCNHTFSPPKLSYLNESDQEIRDLSVDGQVKITNFIAKDCYDHSGRRTFYRIPGIELTTYTTVNNSANKFTMVGCDAEAFVAGRHYNGRKFRTGCTATCEAMQDLKEGLCMGLGCCQTSIPDDVFELTIELRSYSNYSNVWDFNKCSYAFVVDESAFRFSPDNLTNLMDVDELPMVVDWIIGNRTCAEAQTQVQENSTTYACVSPNSSCYEPENGYGYRCRCHEGYLGNPYLTDGCQDISLNDCTNMKYCTNLPGNYTCSCPDGYFGSTRGRDGCPKREDKKAMYIIIDANIVPERSMEQISEVARLGKGCLQVRGEDRPTMKEVSMELEGLLHAGKHSWARNEGNAEEMEILIDKSIELNLTANGEGNSTNVGYDSVGYEYDSLILTGGR